MPHTWGFDRCHADILRPDGSPLLSQCRFRADPVGDASGNENRDGCVHLNYIATHSSSRSQVSDQILGY
eukprot:8520701-Pyramimonas_sp.AAC.1